MHAVEDLMYLRPGLPVQADYLDESPRKKFTVETFVFTLSLNSKDAAVTNGLRHTNEDRIVGTGGKSEWRAWKATSNSPSGIATNNFRPDDLHQCKYRSIEA